MPTFFSKSDAETTMLYNDFDESSQAALAALNPAALAALNPAALAAVNPAALALLNQASRTSDVPTCLSKGDAETMMLYQDFDESSQAALAALSPAALAAIKSPAAPSYKLVGTSTTTSKAIFKVKPYAASLFFFWNRC